jgi:hypothetical protein
MTLAGLAVVAAVLVWTFRRPSRHTIEHWNRKRQIRELRRVAARERWRRWRWPVAVVVVWWASQALS